MNLLVVSSDQAVDAMNILIVLSHGRSKFVCKLDVLKYGIMVRGFDERGIDRILLTFGKRQWVKAIIMFTLCGPLGSRSLFSRCSVLIGSSKKAFVAHSSDKVRAVSFISRYLNVSGQDAVDGGAVASARQNDLTRLTNRGDPILLDETHYPDSHSASFLDHEAVYALGVFARLLINDVGKEPWESA
jgi:hypothetical protein